MTSAPPPSPSGHPGDTPPNQSAPATALAGESAEASATVTSSTSTSDSAGDSTELQGWWKVFASTYVTIFLAEIGDKTQVTTLLLSAKSHQPWLVFAGAGTALICTSLLGVLFGRWLATRLAPRTLEIGAGVTLLVITAGLCWDLFQAF